MPKASTIAFFLVNLLLLSSVYGSYKEEHEGFMKNFKGTSAACVIVCLAHVPASILLLKIVQGNSKSSFLRDYICLVVPLLLNMTVLADYCYFTLLLMVMLEAIYVLRFNQYRVRKDREITDTLSAVNPSKKAVYLSLFKGGNMLITCLAILAVDFRIFPRRFAKTETFGISIMDIGVGTFIVSSAITSRYARGQYPPRLHNIQNNKNEKNEKSYKKHFTNTINFLCNLLIKNWQNWIVLLLGIGRIIILKVLNYQEHVSEYGVHWNFFVTLFCIWNITDILHRLIRRSVLPWLAIIMLMLYQFFLLKTPLTDFIFGASRKNFIYANREGILSLFGYIPMYLLAETFARHLFFNLDKSNENFVHINANEEIIEKENNRHLFTNEINNDNDNENNSDEDGSNTICDDDYTDVTDSDCITQSSGNLLSTSEKSLHSAHKTSEKNDDLITQSMHSNDGHNLLKINENKSLSPDNFDGIYCKWDMLGSKSQRRLFRQLFVVSLVLWLAWLASSSIQQTSRRVANVAFVSLVLALSFTLILLIAIVDSIGDLAVIYRGKKRKNESIGVTEPVGSGVPPVQPVPVRTLECLNTMQLPVFLAANVFTGVINMSMKTIYVSHVNSLMVLFVYSFSITGISWVLMKKL